MSIKDKSYIDVYGINYEWLVYYGRNRALSIPGYRVRTYLAKGNAYVHSGFIVNVYISKDSILQEILYHKPKTANEYVPISPEVFHSILSDKAEMRSGDYWGRTYDWGSLVEFVEMEGRILFKFNARDWNKCVWGVNLQIIHYTFAGQIIRKLGPMLIYANLHPTTIKTLDDCVQIWAAIRGLSSSNWKRDGYYDQEIQGIRHKMAQQVREIEESNNRLEQTCNGAADAMNTLSEKFGISVAL